IVYPNPNSGDFTISSIDNNAHRYVVRDVTGKLIAEENISNRMKVDVQLNVQKGIYFIEVLSPSGSVLQNNKLIVQ
ncbi:MAG: T9SS type A sorting domain-containing protein, partial [Flavobacteriales bacterium]